MGRILASAPLGDIWVAFPLDMSDITGSACHTAHRYQGGQHTMPVTACPAQPLPSSPICGPTMSMASCSESSQGLQTEAGRNLGSLALRAAALSPKTGRLSEVRFHSCLSPSAQSLFQVFN